MTDKMNREMRLAAEISIARCCVAAQSSKKERPFSYVAMSLARSLYYHQAHQRLGLQNSVRKGVGQLYTEVS